MLNNSSPLRRFSILLWTACAAGIALSPPSTLQADEPDKPDTSRGDRMIADYFAAETAKLRDRTLSDVNSLAEWKKKRETYRKQLLEMLGLDPLPKKTPLQAAVTGKVDHEQFTVEKLHYQSRPGLYVTGNLYVPKNLDGKAPAILYVCGHGRVKKNGVSYGNKTHYQHHGAWFARHGYVCLTIDTLQLGEIEGIHHGTYSHGMWWWIARGYTPAGVEAWNCVRALDYLQSREEVDPERIGVTGRSGGGAYSWWIAAIDERIKAAVPVAGITDLENHVVDGCVEGHCDCMFMVNTYRWDYPMVAALVAPRPLLISNTDRDGIFPLDGVVRTYFKVREIYELYGELNNVALHITAGPHQDTQELRVHAFRWLNEHLKNDESLIRAPAEKFFEPEELKVFDALPADERNTEIQESFTEVANEPPIPESQPPWETVRDGWMEELRAKSFRGWPHDPPKLNTKEAFDVEKDGIRFRAYDFTSQENIRLRLYLAHRAGLEKPDLVVLNAMDDSMWTDFLAQMQVGFAEQLEGEQLPEADKESYRQTRGMFQSFQWAMAYVAPRGVGPTQWDESERKQTQHRRRFYLLGQTWHGMQVWDIRRAIQSLRRVPQMAEAPLWLQSEEVMAGNALYASLFEPDVALLELYRLPKSHREGPIYLNVRRILDMPQAVAMAHERSRVRIYQDDASGWQWPRQVAKELGWEKKPIALRKPPRKEGGGERKGKGE